VPATTNMTKIVGTHRTPPTSLLLTAQKIPSFEQDFNACHANRGGLIVSKLGSHKSILFTVYWGDNGRKTLVPIDS
jgi:hypothetical protein